MTAPERRMKVMLQRWGIKFRSQRPIDFYIADFLIPDRRLVVEIDGPSHDHRQQYDAKRTAYIKRKGFTVIRFTNTEVMQTDCEHIRVAILAAPVFPLTKTGADREWYGTAAY